MPRIARDRTRRATASNASFKARRSPADECAGGRGLSRRPAHPGFVGGPGHLLFGPNPGALPWWGFRARGDGAGVPAGRAGRGGLDDESRMAPRPGLRLRVLPRRDVSEVRVSRGSRGTLLNLLSPRGYRCEPVGGRLGPIWNGGGEPAAGTGGEADRCRMTVRGAGVA